MIWAFLLDLEIGKITQDNFYASGETALDISSFLSTNHMYKITVLF